MLTNFEDIKEIGNISPKLEKILPHFLIKIKMHKIANPIKSFELEQHLNISGVEVRSIVQYLRNDGYPIGSSQGGYYFCQSFDEYETTIKHIEERANSLFKTARNMRETNYFDKQNKLF